MASVMFAAQKRDASFFCSGGISFDLKQWWGWW
jgi:hypothetical protein